MRRERTIRTRCANAIAGDSNAKRLTSITAVLAVTYFCAACSQTPTLSQRANLNGPSMYDDMQPELDVATTQHTDSPDSSSDIIFRKTFAGKILTAIALERVTGRKPDPARLSELH